MTPEGCPVIDISPARAGAGGAEKVAAAIDAALRRIGFFVITGHGVDAAVLAETRAACRSFFDLPDAAKRPVQNRAKGSPRGWVPVGASTVGATYGTAGPPDIKESYGLGPPVIPDRFAHLSYYAANVWPAEPAAFEPTVTRYYAAMERLTADMLALFALALDVPPAFFTERFEGHNSTLRLLNYPAQTVPPLPGQVRAGAHTDYGVLTILLVDRAPGGLEVRTRDGDWVAVAAPPDSFVINIGDLMMRWTNDVWLSNLHRVVNPDAAVAAGARRQSIAFFGNPREDVLVECLPSCLPPGEAPRHPPVIAGEHRLLKIRASMPGAT